MRTIHIKWKIQTSDAHYIENTAKRPKFGKCFLRVETNEMLHHHLMLIYVFVLTWVSTGVLQGMLC